jgi:hypothetical protein
MGQPPDKEHGPGVTPKGRVHVISPPPSGSDVLSVQRAAGGTMEPPVPFRERCWRCGVPFAWTTDEDLARCAGIAVAS